MPFNVPFEIQAEIIKRLPVKSLIQFRSVSKPWKSLIDSSKFIATYNVHRPQHLLVCYDDPEEHYKLIYVSFVDDDTFPQHKFSPSVPMSIKQMDFQKILGMSQGLLCVYNLHETAVLWNPSIRKSVVVDVPTANDPGYSRIIGFGVCPRTSDPKLVKILYPHYSEDFSTLPWQVEVFTLSSRAWRSVSINQPRKSYLWSLNQVVIDSFIYWLAAHKISTDTGLQWRYVIMSFDLTSELRELPLPDGLALFHPFDMLIYKLRDSLVLLEPIEMHGYTLWMMLMEHGVPNSFTKLFTIEMPNMTVRIVFGFRLSGEPLTVLLDDPEEDSKGAVCVYKPYSKHINDIGIYANAYQCFASSYTETLLLLDQKDCRVIVPEIKDKDNDNIAKSGALNKQL